MEPKYEFTLEELRALYRVLEKEWVSYNDYVAYNVVKRIADIVNEKLDRRAGITAQ